MEVGIRVDASIQIGTGHFMRCLTLADALKRRGATIRFVSRQLPGHLCDMVVAKEHQLVPLESNANGATTGDLAHAHWLSTSQPGDAQDSVQALAHRALDWLVVDHYALDARWETALRPMTKNILVIDDLADRQHDCDVLLDQNYYTDMNNRYTGKVPAHCRLFLGPRYALLRDEFRRLHQTANLRTGPVKHVLVFFGGVDADNCTGRSIEALVKLGIEGMRVNVVIGAQHPHREQIEAECARNGFRCLVQTDRMAELMAAADLALGAGGSATWERCCMGLPCATIAIAQNQVRTAMDIADYGATKFIGIAADVDVEKLILEVGNILESTWIAAASRLGRDLVDAQGVSRIIEAMERYDS